MALKDQPYFPFYVKDFDGDEKLKECDAVSHGVYIRIMCLMHKSKVYGKVLLEQKYQQMFQQNNQQIPSMCSDIVGAFAIKLAKHLPFDVLVIQHGLCQLLETEVLHIEGNYLCQKRMVKDGQISEVRASAGKKSASGRGGINNFVGTKPTTNGSTNIPTNGSTKDQQITAIVIANEDNRGIGNTEGVQGEENLGEEETEVDHYLGNWHLSTDITDCLKYYEKEEEFKNDRVDGLKTFERQYVTLPEDELLERLFAWGKKFNEATRGKYPNRPMRGDNSWVQHFHNWLKKKDLTENPISNFNNKKPEIKDKTAKEYLATRR